MRSATSAVARLSSSLSAVTRIRPLLVTSVRHFGLLDSVKEKITGKSTEQSNLEKEKKAFQEYVDKVTKVEKYTFEQWYQLMKEEAAKAGATGWKSYIPGVASQDQQQELKRMLNICEAFSPEERQDYLTVKKDQKLRIAAAANVSIADVTVLLRQYENAWGLHAWLRKRITNNQRLPTSAVELRAMAIVDRPPVGPLTQKFVTEQRKKMRGGRGMVR